MSRKWWSIAALAAIGVMCLCVLWPCIHTVRETQGWIYSANSIKQIGLALYSYHEVYGHFPPAVICDKEGQPLYSWRVAILPFLEQSSLYNQFSLDEPWDSPHNLPLTLRTPRCYVPALGWGDDDPGLTRYQVLVGPGTAFERSGLTFDDFPDGLGNTLLVVDAANPVQWAKPIDLIYDPDQPLPGLGGRYTKSVYFLCREVGTHSGFCACFADGRCRFIRDSTDERTLRALITRNGGEPVDVDDLD
jgi:hypothetical protein